MTVKAVKIRAGLYRLEGARCRCGGELNVERCSWGEFRWETFCTKCLGCDCNGWATLRLCVAESPDFFNPRHRRATPAAGAGA